MKPSFTHYSHQSRRAHRVSFLEKATLWVFIPLVILGLTAAAIALAGGHFTASSADSIGYLVMAVLHSFSRIFIAYVFALAIGIVLTLAVARSHFWERVLIPVYDVLQSVPVLVFFPVIIVLFIHYGLFNTAAVFILFLTMIWSITFNSIGALRVIPSDVLAVPHIFKLGKWQSLRKVILPALFPSLVTGSLLAWAAGWNILIVAEVLHTYVPASENASDVFGIGSVLVQASAAGDQSLFLSAIVVIVLAIMGLNIFVWQRLLRYAERYKFD